MKLYCICPFSRPENILNVIANFQRQTYPEKELIIACNGKAEKYANKYAKIFEAYRNIHIITSPTLLVGGQSAAKNAAIRYAKQKGGEYICTFDDDDIYSASYLSEVGAAFESGAIICGKSQIYVKIKNELYSICEREGGQNIHADIHGPTISFKITNKTPLFPLIQFSEDLLFVQYHRNLGFFPRILSPDYFCYVRGGGSHTYPLSPDLYIYAQKSAETNTRLLSSGVKEDLGDEGVLQLLEKEIMPPKNEIVNIPAEEVDLGKIFGANPVLF